jgi:hypothetical protein
VLRADGAEQLVREDVVLAFSERRPCLDLHAAFFQERLRRDLLVERVRLDLVDRRGDVVEHDQIHHAIGMKVADTDRADPTFTVELLHRTPGAVDVTVRLLDRVEVEDVEAERPPPSATTHPHAKAASSTSKRSVAASPT